MAYSEYRDNTYLAGYDLSLDLFNFFGLKVKDIMPVRNVFIIDTNKGRKILKKVEYSIEELEFIDSSIKYIKNNFTRIFDFVKTKDGDIFLDLNGDIYCMLDLIDGRESEYDNPVDVGIASKALGELHRASAGFRYDLPKRNNCGKMIESFKRKLEEMQFFKCIVNMYEKRNKFDDIFINNVDYYIKKAQKSIDIMEKTQYYKLCGEDDKVVLCHHDLAHHNILIKNGEAYFIDFDCAVIDIKVHDLCNFINKVIKNFAFDFEKAESIIENYCTTNTLDKRELEVLYGMLSFPEDFYFISRDYYTKRKRWDEQVFVYRLNKKVSGKEYMESFLDEFKKKYVTV